MTYMSNEGEERVERAVERSEAGGGGREESSAVYQ